MKVDYEKKFRKMIESGEIPENATSAQTKIFVPSALEGMTKEDIDNAPWSEELFLYLIAQDQDKFCLPYCGAYYNQDDKLLYPLYSARSETELKKLRNES